MKKINILVFCLLMLQSLLWGPTQFDTGLYNVQLEPKKIKINSEIVITFKEELEENYKYSNIKMILNLPNKINGYKINSLYIDDLNLNIDFFEVINKRKIKIPSIMIDEIAREEPKYLIIENVRDYENYHLKNVKYDINSYRIAKKKLDEYIKKENGKFSNKLRNFFD